MTDFKLIDDFFEGKQLTDEEWTIFEKKLDEDDAFLGYYETQKLFRRLGRLKMNEALKEQTSTKRKFKIDIFGQTGLLLELFELLESVFPKGTYSLQGASYGFLEGNNDANTFVQISDVEDISEYLSPVFKFVFSKGKKIEFHFKGNTLMIEDWGNFNDKKILNLLSSVPTIKTKII